MQKHSPNLPSARPVAIMCHLQAGFCIRPKANPRALFTPLQAIGQEASGGCPRRFPQALGQEASVGGTRQCPIRVATRWSGGCTTFASGGKPSLYTFCHDPRFWPTSRATLLYTMAIILISGYAEMMPPFPAHSRTAWVTTVVPITPAAQVGRAAGTPGGAKECTLHTWSFALVNRWHAGRPTASRNAAASAAHLP